MKCIICFESQTGLKPSDFFVKTKNGCLFHYNCVLKMVVSGPTTCPICDEELAFHPFTRVADDSNQPSTSAAASQQAQARNAPVDEQNEQANDNPWVRENWRPITSSFEHPVSYTVEPDYTFKVVVLGDMNVGKSSLLQRYADDKYDPILAATVGCDLRVKVLRVGGKNVQLNLWDTAGQERHRAIVDVYLRRANGIIFCFDITDSKSFLSLQEWCHFAKRCVPDDIPKVIVGCKSDLWSECAVHPTLIRNVSEMWNAQYIYASAKDSTNVEVVFRTIAVIILEKNLAGTWPLPPPPEPSSSKKKETKAKAESGTVKLCASKKNDKKRKRPNKCCQ